MEEKKRIRTFQDLEVYQAAYQAMLDVFTLVDAAVCERLIDVYDKTSRQCYNLALAWDRFTERKSGRGTANA